eukprot:6205173-Ditylum_brightwellii.AAC.1
MTWFCYGRQQRQEKSNTLLHGFRWAQGTQVGIEMWCLTMRDEDMKAVIPKADSFWKKNKNDALGLFGATYVDTTPASW